MGDGRLHGTINLNERFLDSMRMQVFILAQTFEYKINYRINIGSILNLMHLDKNSP